MTSQARRAVDALAVEAKEREGGRTDVGSKRISKFGEGR
jgi:hypothetical protein